MPKIACLKGVCAVQLLLAVIWSCSGEHPTDGLPMGRLIVEHRVPIDQAEGSPMCVVSMAVDSVTGTDSVARAINGALAEQVFRTASTYIRQAAENAANDFARDYVATLTPFYHADRDNECRRSWYEYSYRLTTKATQSRHGYMAYVATHELCEGGAHKVMVRKAINFSTRTGHRLQLTDMMAPGYEPGLRQLLLQALMSKVGATSASDLRDKGYLQDMEMYVPSNFTIGKAGLTFIYNPYEIAPHGYGCTELLIDYNQLKPLLKTIERDGIDN